MGELMTQLSSQTSRLVRDEMRLAQKEFVESAKHAGIGAGRSPFVCPRSNRGAVEASAVPVHGHTLAPVRVAGEPSGQEHRPVEVPAAVPVGAARLDVARMCTGCPVLPRKRRDDKSGRVVARRGLGAPTRSP